MIEMATWEITAMPTQEYHEVVDSVEAPNLPPTDLYSDEPPMESDLHLRQMLLLIMCLDWLWQGRTDVYFSGNMTIYYSRYKIKTHDFRGPDFFVVLDTERRPRKSWTLWEEDGKYPNVIIEVLSDSTAQVDKTTKKQLYQDTFRTPEYFWFDPTTLEFQGFSLNNGSYTPILTNSQGWMWSEQMQLFLGVHNQQLRFFTPEGELVPTPQEAALAVQAEAQQTAHRADQEAQRADQEAQRADQETQRAERLAAKLRELNIDPDSL
jgi:Uma2 family endonuclease